MTKVDIFSGFLGAGKTTLIKKLISEAYEEKDIVLIENEFGEIGVDTGFLRETGIQINEMTAGCICCTLVGDFGKALNEVIEKYNPSRILIEPSGVGKLSDVILAVQGLNNEKIEMGGFTTVVDAKRYKQYLRNFGEFYKNQVENASTIILSHQGELSEEKIEECRKTLAEMNPDANIVTTDWNEISGKKILSIMESKKALDAEIEKLRAEILNDDCDDDDEGELCSCGCGHRHHGHSADEVFEEIGTTTANKFSRNELVDIMQTLDECGEILRAKGIVENVDGGWLEFDYVPVEGEVRASNAEATGMIVVIGTSLKKDKINKMFRLG